MSDTRRGRWRAAAALALAVAGAPAAVPVEAAVPPDCSAFTYSPSFAIDRTALCTHLEPAGSRAVLRVRVTTDAARSWRTVTAGGLAWSGTPGRTFVPRFSPRYATDRTVLMGTDSGLYASRDLGETWVPVDPLVTSGTRLNPTFFPGSSALPVPVPGIDADRVYAAYASGVKTARIDVGTGLHQPASGVPSGTAAFVPYRASAAVPWQVLALGVAADPGGADQTIGVFGCTQELSCTEQRFVFPAGFSVLGVWSEGGALVVALLRSDMVPGSRPVTRVQLWRSGDGTRFARWAAAERAIAPAMKAGVGAPDISVATNAASPRRMYLRVTTAFRNPTLATLPQEQLFRSDDGGTTFRPVGYARADAQRGPRGGLPFQGGAPGPERNGVYLTPDGRLFALGTSKGPGRTWYGVWCSLDGVRWTVGCP